MKKLMVCTFLALALAASFATGVASASGETDAVGASYSEGVVGDGLGALAAVGCGMFGRALGSGLVHVGVIAGAIATCAYMFIDAIFFDR